MLVNNCTCTVTSLPPLPIKGAPKCGSVRVAIKTFIKSINLARVFVYTCLQSSLTLDVCIAYHNYLFICSYIVATLLMVCTL